MRTLQRQALARPLGAEVHRFGSLDRTCFYSGPWPMVPRCPAGPWVPVRANAMRCGRHRPRTLRATLGSALRRRAGCHRCVDRGLPRCDVTSEPAPLGPAKSAECCAVIGVAAWGRAALIREAPAGSRRPKGSIRHAWPGLADTATRHADTPLSGTAVARTRAVTPCPAPPRPLVPGPPTRLCSIGPSRRPRRGVRCRERKGKER